MRLKYKIVCLIIAFGFTGCDKFLEEDPKSLIAPNNFYNSDEEAEAAINGVYGQWRTQGTYSRTLMIWNTFGTDEMVPTRIFGDAIPLLDYTLSATERGFTDQIWNSMWRIITNANGVIANVDGNSNIDETKQRTVVAEAKFLRALAYYHLTHGFGDAQFYTEDLTTDEIELLGQTPANEIVAYIVQDLQETADYLPNEAIAGKATKWAAKTLQVKLLLYLNRWEEAEQVAEEIVTSSPHQLDPDYGHIWETRDETNLEVIWKLAYVSNVSSHDYGDWYNPRIGDEPADPSQKQLLLDALAANNEGFTGYGLSGPSPTLVSGFDSDDIRKNSTIINEYEGIPLRFTYCGKFQGLNQTTSPRANHGEDIIVFRLADVILMLAEAENEQGKVNEAAAHIDLIRNRAYEPDRPSLVDSGISQEGLKDILYNERRNELAGEGHRRYDLIRWGKLIETIQNVDYGPNYMPQNNIQPHHVLFPINPNFIEIANKRAGKEVLKQNPGY